MMAVACRSGDVLAARQVLIDMLGPLDDGAFVRAIDELVEVATENGAARERESHKR
jgi:hypothetical protein